MLEVENHDKLKTWQIASDNFTKPQKARQNFDHRKIYLDYEGEVKSKGGSVKISDTGTYEILEWGKKIIRIKLSGKNIKTAIKLELTGTQAGENALWQLTSEKA